MEFIVGFYYHVLILVPQQSDDLEASTSGDAYFLGLSLDKFRAILPPGKRAFCPVARQRLAGHTRARLGRNLRATDA